MPRILALWAHPRSLSTALERVFIERGDFVVMHEPFSALYYMHQRRAKAAHADFDASEVVDYELIRDRILHEGSQRPVCFKDMCYHCHDDVRKDDSFLRGLTNVFLIRDPRQAIASHFAKNPNVTCEEIGYEKQASIFRRVCELTGEIPAVIAAEDLQWNPAATMKALCSRVGLEYRADALYWQPGHLDEWDNWKPWHDEVAKSSGIHAGRTHYVETVNNDSRQAGYYRHHQPFYEEMRRHCLATRRSDVARKQTPRRVARSRRPLAPVSY